MKNAAQAMFKDWVRAIDGDAPVSTYQGTYELPFQRWFKFKEAYSPLLVQRMFARARTPPLSSADPCGGCGTTALTSQFLGAQPTVIEQNPFLADVVESKLTSYEATALVRDFGRWRRESRQCVVDLRREMAGMPPTLVQTRDAGRWVYPSDVATILFQYRNTLATIENTDHRRLFRVLLGSLLVEVSNTLVNGKGRRYRESWRARQKTAEHVRARLDEAFERAVFDVARFKRRACTEATVLRGDCRERITDIAPVDICMFSPPYPNSFDYTDIYNLELWMLGYIDERSTEHAIRRGSIRSHVQIKRDYEKPKFRSRTLRDTLSRLSEMRTHLWSPDIPDMVGSYFVDMGTILGSARDKLNRGGRIVIVVGDSAYAGVPIPVGRILTSIAKEIGLECTHQEKLRRMRMSAQQGGQHQLVETLLEFKAMS
jgi:hypothetical protein